MKIPEILSFDFDHTMERSEYYDLTKRYRGTKHEYIRRDVVIEAMERMKTVMPCDIVDLNAILDKVIDKTNND